MDPKSIPDTITIILNHNEITAEDRGARRVFIGIANVEDLKTDAEGNYMKL